MGVNNWEFGVIKKNSMVFIGKTVTKIVCLEAVVPGTLFHVGSLLNIPNSLVVGPRQMPDQLLVYPFLSTHHPKLHIPTKMGAGVIQTVREKTLKETSRFGQPDNQTQ